MGSYSVYIEAQIHAKSQTMDVEEALEFIDQLVYVKTGKHLNDLEREVFSGSWQGHTYEKMYPINPEYVEKDVG